MFSQHSAFSRRLVFLLDIAQVSPINLKFSGRKRELLLLSKILHVQHNYTVSVRGGNYNRKVYNFRLKELEIQF